MAQADDPGGNGPHEEAHQGRATVAAHEDQVGLEFIGLCHDGGGGRDAAEHPVMQLHTPFWPRRRQRQPFAAGPRPPGGPAGPGPRPRIRGRSPPPAPRRLGAAGQAQGLAWDTACCPSSEPVGAGQDAFPTERDRLRNFRVHDVNAPLSSRIKLRGCSGQGVNGGREKNS